MRNKKYYLTTILFSFFFFLTSMIDKEPEITVFMIGDSTMANKQSSVYPEMGWGQVFPDFFQKQVKFENRAMDGRSTSSYIGEGRWNAIEPLLKEGDFIFIQFGHNDEKVNDYRGTTIYQFKENLKRFVFVAQSKKVTPILLTPVTRRSFVNGELVDSHQEYSKAVREVARELNVFLIDMHKKSAEIVKQMGDEKSKELFMWLKPGEHPNYPSGKYDNTHFRPEGARVMAKIVVDEIKEQNILLESKLK